MTLAFIQITRSASELETNIVSIERVQEYAELESEVRYFPNRLETLFSETCRLN